MVKDAVSNLEKALKLNLMKHDTIVLGKCLHIRVFFTPEHEIAKIYWNVCIYKIWGMI